MAIGKKRTERRKLRDCRAAEIKASQAELRRSIAETERLVGESDKMLRRHRKGRDGTEAKCESSIADDEGEP
jgi:hypothetical protein